MLICLNRTDRNISRLPSTVLKDAKDIYNVLVDPSHCGYLSSNVKLLLNEGAARSKIENELNFLSESTNQSSTVFIYFSGHGGQLKTESSVNEYLLPVDTVIKTKTTSKAVNRTPYVGYGV